MYSGSPLPDEGPSGAPEICAPDARAPDARSLAAAEREALRFLIRTRRAGPFVGAEEMRSRIAARIERRRRDADDLQA